MTTSPPDDAATAEEAGETAAPAVDGENAAESATAEAELAERIAGIVGSESWSADFRNAKVGVDRSQWVDAVEAVRDQAGLDFFSFLSAVDWSNEVEVGDPLEDEVDEHFEVLVRLSSGRTNDAVTLSTTVPKDDAQLPTLVGVFGGANWHERETAEMFGIDFVGHPNLNKLYLTDEFEGYPLRKSYPLLSREVKPWPGTVDVEDMPSTENVEGEASAQAPDPSPQAPDPIPEAEAGGGDAEGGAS